MGDFAKLSTSMKKRKRSSPESNNLDISVASFSTKLFKLLLDAKDPEKSLDERKNYAKYGLETVLKTNVASIIKELVSFMKKPRTNDGAENFTQTQRDIQEISESEDSSSTSASDTMPKMKKVRKRSSPKFKTAMSAAKNLAVLLFKIKIALRQATLSDQEKRSLVVNALKSIHNAEIFETMRKLQDALKEIMEIEKKEKTDQREPSQNSNSPTKANDSSTTPNEESPLFDDILSFDAVSIVEMH